MTEAISRKDIHIFVYKFCLAALVCFLPLSKYLMSITFFILAINWLAEGGYKEKWLILIRKPEMILFASMLLIYVFGSAYSENFQMALVKVRNVLPVLLLSLVTGTSYKLSRKYVKSLLILFSCAVACAAITNLVLFPGQFTRGINEIRQLSFFMSHINFSLLINMSVFSLVYIVAFPFFRATWIEKLLCSLLIVWLIIYLFLSGSLTGIVILTVLIIFTLMALFLKTRHRIFRTISLMTILIGVSVVICWIVIFYTKNFTAVPVDFRILDTKTKNGNLYDHNPDAKALENGNYIDIYNCDTELRKEWNKRSTIPYDGLDSKGQNINNTIKRYMTSKGMRKDSSAIYQLSSRDIESIENGITNHVFNEASFLYQRIYETLWELHIYKETGYVKYHSFTQRLEFLRLSMENAREHILFGTGTGDVYDGLLAEARKTNRLVDEKWEGKPHNQFVYFMLAFGIAGFIWIMFSWMYPVVRSKKYRYYLFNVFLIASFLSMLVDDTLESYNGIAFFAFFYCLFVFAKLSD